MHALVVLADIPFEPVCEGILNDDVVCLSGELPACKSSIIHLVGRATHLQQNHDGYLCRCPTCVYNTRILGW